MDFKSEMRERIKLHNAYIVEQVRAGLFDDDKNEESIDSALSSLLALIEKRNKELLQVLEKAKVFIEYARYELEDGKATVGSQFPHKEDADIEMARLEKAVSEIKQRMGI